MHILFHVLRISRSNSDISQRGGDGDPDPPEVEGLEAYDESGDGTHSESIF